ncbi:MAG: hypothetical protein R2705_03915 [Ilumatobacteraceae bacterium]
MAGAGNDVVEGLERFDGVGSDEAGSDHDVLVRERHQRSVVAPMRPFRIESRFEDRFTDARPSNTHGVP